MNSTFFRASFLIVFLLFSHNLHGIIGSLAVAITQKLTLQFAELVVDTFGLKPNRAVEESKKIVPESFTVTPCTTSSGVTTQIQKNELPNIPQLLETTMSSLPKTTQPVFINLNLHSQQMASSVSTTETHSPGKISESGHLIRGSMREILQHAKKSLFFWISEHKLALTATTLSSLYAGLQFSFWKISRALTHESSWSQWKNQNSLEDLYNLGQSKLAVGLLSTFRSRINSTNDPLADAQTVIKEIDSESATLSKYRSLNAVVNAFRISKLFFINKALIVSIPDRVQRLSYLKSCLEAWMRENKRDYSILFKNDTI